MTVIHATSGHHGVHSFILLHLGCHHHIFTSYIENTEGKYVLLVGGFDGTDYLSTNERFDIATGQWTILQGVTLPKPIASGSMVTVNNNKEVLYIGGYDGSNYQSGIWRMDGDMSSWTFAGNLTTARSNAVSLLAPPSTLPQLCTTTPNTATAIPTTTTQSQTTTITTTTTQSQTTATTTTQSQTTTTTTTATTTT